MKRRIAKNSHRIVQVVRRCAYVGVIVVLLAGMLPPGKAEAGYVALNFSTISSGASNTCGIANGKAYCWGANQWGQVGAGTIVSNYLTPMAVSTSGVLNGKTVTDISVGFGSVCAVADGAAYCWGTQSSDGSLGDGTFTDSNVPVAVSTSGVLSGKTVTSISVGYWYACAVANGKAYCWGRGGTGALGNAGNSNSGVPVAVDTTGVLSGKTIATISTSETTTCALTTDGIVACWGGGESGQIGHGYNAGTNTPVAVDTTGVLSGKTVVSLSVGGAHTCALASDGKLYCWGYNAWGQLGNNTTTGSNVPVAVAMTGALSGKTIALLDSGYENSCVKVTTGELYCWGMGTYGEIGNGGNNDRYLVPTATTMNGALAGRTVSSIDGGLGDTNSGAASICVTTTSGRAYCWGTNTSGQAGTDNTTSYNVPTAVITPVNFTPGSYRLYQNANSVTPGSPLAATDTSAQLATPGAAFRLRMGISAPSGSGDLGSLNTYKLQFAQRSAATCSAQTTDFYDVTASTAIAWNTNAGVTNGAAISTTANDPTANGTTTAQIYQSAIGPFGAPTDTPAGNTAMWDFSLKDNSAPANTNYCFRIIYGYGGALENTPTAYPQVMTAPASTIGVTIVDAGGAAVGSPSYAMTTGTVKTSCQALTGTFAVSAQRIRITSTSASNGWSLSLAPTNGPTDLWNRSDNNAKYDFNDPSGSPAGCNSGSDGDGYAGQLTVNPSPATVTAQSGCNNTGITKGSSAAYNQGTLDAITVLSASSSAAVGCYWDMTGISLSQQIPAGQPAGAYSINMTLTVVAL